MYLGLTPAIEEPRFEPRERWRHQEPIRGEAGVRLKLIVRRLEGRPHLPVVELKQAA